MKAILKITVVKEVDEEDKEFYEELIEDNDITALFEVFEPEVEGKIKLEFKE